MKILKDTMRNCLITLLLFISALFVVSCEKSSYRQSEELNEGHWYRCPRGQSSEYLHFSEYKGRPTVLWYIGGENGLLCAYFYEVEGNTFYLTPESKTEKPTSFTVLEHIKDDYLSTVWQDGITRNWTRNSSGERDSGSFNDDGHNHSHGSSDDDDDDEWDGWFDCLECGGTGICQRCKGTGLDRYGYECIRCKGTGKCDVCDGYGGWY